MRVSRNNFTEQQIVDAVHGTSSYTEAAEKLGIPGKRRVVAAWYKDIVDTIAEYHRYLEHQGKLDEQRDVMEQHLIDTLEPFKLTDDGLKDVPDCYPFSLSNLSLDPDGIIKVEVNSNYAKPQYTFTVKADPYPEGAWSGPVMEYEVGSDGRLHESKSTYDILMQDKEFRDGFNAFEYPSENPDMEFEDNSCILVISDLHAPYQHVDALEFLKAIKAKYRPTRIVCLGDEVNMGAMSFHTSDPDLDAAGTELSKARAVMKELHSIFPKMQLMHSNHGSMLYRRGKENGIPKFMLKSYNDVLGIPEGDWEWVEDLTLKLPNGNYCHFHHSRGANALKVAQSLGMSYVSGHHHSQFNISYYGTPFGLHFAGIFGCLIDDSSLSFAYNKLSSTRPVIGTGIIINSQPKLLPLIMNKGGRWTGVLE